MKGAQALNMPINLLLCWHNENTLAIDFNLEPCAQLTHLMADFTQFLKIYCPVSIDENVIAYNQILLVFNLAELMLINASLDAWLLSHWQKFLTENHIPSPINSTAHISSHKTFSTSQDSKKNNAEIHSIIKVPVCYHASLAPDLEAVAEFANISCEQVIQLHTQKIYTVFALGFAPGFPYLGFVAPQIAMPRKASPRLKVAAGSVGIAHNQTGIYPRQSPGGWQIIGRTPKTIFDTTQPIQEASFLSVGMQIQFEAICLGEYQELVNKG